MEEIRVYIGVDPGRSGATAAIFPDGEVRWMLHKETDHDLSDFIATKILRDGTSFFAALENVHSMPGQGVASTFKFGESKGLLKGLLVAYQIPFILPSPRKWQTALGIHSISGEAKVDHKNRTKAAAQQLYPSIKVTHGNADAILLAEYARKEDVNARER